MTSLRLMKSCAGWIAETPGCGTAGGFLTVSAGLEPPDTTGLIDVPTVSMDMPFS
jgi:hypothetical protein